MKLERLVSILMTLLDKKRINAQDLADIFEVSKRTIYRDIDALNLAGIPIRSTAGVGGGFEIMENYKLNKQVFSTADLSAILMGLSGLSDLMEDQQLTHALTKVKSFVPENAAQEINLKANQIVIDLTPWLGNKNIQAALKIIKIALQENKLLTFDYRDRYGQQSRRWVEPYQLVLKGNEWYWQGFCLKRNDYRLFKIKRSQNLQMSTKTFTPRDYQKPLLEFSDILSTLQNKIQLRIHVSLMDRLLDFCSDEHFSPVAADYYLVDFPFIENDFYYNLLFSFGNKCECLGPPHIRQELKRRLKELETLYQD